VFISLLSNVRLHYKSINTIDEFINKDINIALTKHIDDSIKKALSEKEKEIEEKNKLSLETKKLSLDLKEQARLLLEEVEKPKKLHFPSSEEEMIKNFPNCMGQIEFLLLSLHQSITAVKISMSDIKSTSDQVFNVIRGIAENSEKASTDLREVFNAMANNEISLDKTYERSHDLSISSITIDNILNTIRTIAAKINVLSYNAAIVSSKAGKYGETFKVVSDEIRLLGNRTSEEIVKVKQIVTDVQENIKQLFFQVNNSKKDLLHSNELIKATMGYIHGIILSIEIVLTTSHEVHNEISNQEGDINDLYEAIEKVVFLFGQEIDYKSIGSIITEINEISKNFSDFKNNINDLLKKIIHHF
jgi:methyl-accepting chemotaxis protein